MTPLPIYLTEWFSAGPYRNHRHSVTPSLLRLQEPTGRPSTATLTPAAQRPAQATYALRALAVGADRLRGAATALIVAIFLAALVAAVASVEPGVGQAEEGWTCPAGFALDPSASAPACVTTDAIGPAL